MGGTERPLRPPPGKYVLEGKTPVREPDLAKWRAWFETSDRVVRFDLVTCHGRPLLISTIFLGLNQNLGLDGEPILFESIVFDPKGLTVDGERTATWDEAEAIHAILVRRYADAQPAVVEIPAGTCHTAR